MQNNSGERASLVIRCNWWWLVQWARSWPPFWSSMASWSLVWRLSESCWSCTVPSTVESRYEAMSCRPSCSQLKQCAVLSCPAASSNCPVNQYLVPCISGPYWLLSVPSHVPSNFGCYDAWHELSSCTEAVVGWDCTFLRILFLGGCCGLFHPFCIGVVMPLFPVWSSSNCSFSRPGRSALIVLTCRWEYTLDGSAEKPVCSPGFCFHCVSLQADRQIYEPLLDSLKGLRHGRLVVFSTVFTLFITLVCSSDNMLTHAACCHDLFL